MGLLPNSIRTVRKDHKDHNATVSYGLEDEFVRVLQKIRKFLVMIVLLSICRTVISSVFVAFVIFPYCDLRAKPSVTETHNA